MSDRPLSPQVFQILLSLAGQDLHGYAIIQDIADRTDGRLRLTASTLYAALKRLLDEGLIEAGRKDEPAVDTKKNGGRIRPPFRARTPLETRS